MPHDPTPLDPVLRRAQVDAATGLGRSTIYAMMAEGTFPAPVRLGRRAVGWRQSAIRAWLDARTESLSADLPSTSPVTSVAPPLGTGRHDCGEG